MNQQPVTARPPSPSKGPLIQTILQSSLSPNALAPHTAVISDCELLASFNWIEDEKAPTIMIPGR